MEKEQIKTTISQLLSCDSVAKEFAALVLQEHRTLQQSMFRLFLGTINEWSKLQKNQYDLRNEYTVQTSKKIMEMLGGVKGVPLI